MSPHVVYNRYLSAAQLLAMLAPLALIGCGSMPQPVSQPAAPTTRSVPPSKASSDLPALPPAGSGRGGYYMDDGPGDAPPENLLATLDAEPRIEPYSTRGNRPYVVFGKKYTPITDERPFRQTGVGSWYGKKFHGQKTSSGERYDMYKMTAAHPTLPIPSYVRVTNLANGRQVIVRVNDRGPFHAGRVIDLSYTAALKLGYLSQGHARLEVERLLPEDIARLATERKGPQTSQEQAIPAPQVQSAEGLAAAEAPQEPVPPVPEALFVSSTPGFYLQLGAYAQADNAEAARARLQGSAAALAPLEVVEAGLFYRLYSGPFVTKAEAEAAALQLQDSGMVKPMIVQR